MKPIDSLAALVRVVAGCDIGPQAIVATGVGGWGRRAQHIARFAAGHPYQDRGATLRPPAVARTHQSSVRRKRVTAIVIATSIRPVSASVSKRRLDRSAPLSMIARTMRR